MKKKIAGLSMLLCLLAVFFVVQVKAENTYIRNIRTYSGYKSAVSLTYSATACQFHYNSDTSLTGGIYSPVLITVRFTNNGSNDIKIANSYVDLTFTNTAEVQRYDCYTSDLMIQVAGTAGQHTPRYNIIGGDGFSYNGHIVVPHNSSIYLVFEVDIAGNLNTSSGQPEGPGLDAVFVSVADSDVQTGEFISGIIPRQLDEIDTLLNNLYTSQSAATTQLQNMYSDVHNLLTAIKNQIVFTGTFSLDRLINNGINGTIGNGWTTLYGKEYVITYYVSGLVPVSTAVTIDGLSQQDLQYNVYKCHVETIFNIRGSGRLLASMGSFGFNVYKFGTNPIAVDNVQIKSPIHDSYYRKADGTVYYPNGLYQVSTNQYVFPSGRYTLIFSYDMYYDNTQTVTFTAPTVAGNLMSGVSSMTEYTGELDYNPYDNVLLNLIYKGILSPTQQNADTVTESNSAGSMSDQIHAQEEQWYRENDTAMENVGLSNYRYTQNQQNGIVGAVLQFEQMWLALGDWTLVYIFTLMLSLAVFILRHEPTTRMKQAREERSAFYAEAGRYYRESARPSNEFVQRVRKFNGK